jgi:hypothetical protein
MLRIKTNSRKAPIRKSPINQAGKLGAPIEMPFPIAAYVTTHARGPSQKIAVLIAKAIKGSP